MTVKVVTDTSSVVPEAIAGRLDIRSVPLRLHVGGRTYRDGIDLAPEEFYRRIADGERATTSSPSPGDFLAAYRDAREAGAEALVVPTVAVSFSAVNDAARLAAAEIPEVPVHLVDTASAVTGAGLVVIAAAEAAAAGETVEGVLATARRIRERIELLATLKSLRHLARSGKVPAVPALAGSTFRVRPVVRLIGGRVIKEAIAFSGRGALRKISRAIPPGASGLRAGVFHAADPQGAVALEEMIRIHHPDADVFVTTFSPAMGAHTGPGVVGAAWWADS